MDAARQDSSLPTLRLSGADYMSLAILASLACTMMFWHLGQRYLWQDEAATAVLAERMLEFGKPLAYDGRNLITWDINQPVDAEDAARLARNPEAMVRAYAARGEFKHDTAWIGHPWGQFVLAAASLQALGHGTWQARAPFAMCGVMTVVVLYVIVRQLTQDRLQAWLAALLLISNVYWVLHMRQCRYYAPSSLLLLLTLFAYLRWQDARRAAAVLFVVTAWTLFQFDYGTWFPVVGILAIDSLWRQRRTVLNSLLVFLALAAAIAPWVFYYELFSRVRATVVPLYHRGLWNYFFFNQYLVPVVVLVIAGWLLWRERGSMRLREQQFLTTAWAITASGLFWVPVVIHAPHHRYLVAATPLACVVLANVVVRFTDLIRSHLAWIRWRTATAVVLVGFLVVSPWLSNVASVPYLLESGAPRLGILIRAEWNIFCQDLRGVMRDPNRELVTLLQSKLGPEDEVVINYEDVPLMFYLPNGIRGGVACFRVRDAKSPPPRLLVFNRSAVGLYQPWQMDAFNQLLRQYQWIPVRSDLLSQRASNCPDPALHFAQDPPQGRIEIFELAPQSEGARETPPDTATSPGMPAK